MIKKIIHVVIFDYKRSKMDMHYFISAISYNLFAIYDVDICIKLSFTDCVKIYNKNDVAEI
jgi:hypothetical protein